MQNENQFDTTIDLQVAWLSTTLSTSVRKTLLATARQPFIVSSRGEASEGHPPVARA